MKTAVIIPFRNRLDLLTKCLTALVPSLPSGVAVVTIDNGTSESFDAHPELRRLLALPSVVRLSTARPGPGAARNEGLEWCWNQSIELVVLLDSDCVPPANFVSEHIAHHRRLPDAVCIGGAMRGVGGRFWTRVDGAMSWFITSMPGAPERAVTAPAHVPTTNMSIKLLPQHRTLLRFSEDVATGEDLLFCRGLQDTGLTVTFCPTPELRHHDRVGFGPVLRHQYQWGVDAFAVRFGERAVRNVPLRIAFSIAFVPIAPLYAIYATRRNLAPWLRLHPEDRDLVFGVFVINLIKGAAAIQGALFPQILKKSANAAAVPDRVTGAVR